MDTDISRWVMEFLLRSSVPDSLIQKALNALPLSGADSRLKKTLLLRTLRCLLLKASLSETVLQILELLEEIDGASTSVALRRAYVAVAVECTVKYLAAAPDDPEGEFSGAVRRIWRGRVAAVEARRSGLMSGELTRWRDDVEAALGDSRACERLADLNSRREAMKELMTYLNEAWESMGPSFLESVAAMSKGLTKQKEDFVVSGNWIDNGHDNGNDGDHACMEDVAMHDENQAMQQLEEKIDANPEVGGCDLPLQRDKVVRSKLATSDTNIEPPIENQSPDVDVPDPNVCRSIVLFQSNDANLGKKSSVHCSDMHQPNLMERNRTAHTLEWDDSIDNSPQVIQPRRKKRKWSSLEEETLRAGVKMFGEGNWATIRSFYSNIFDNRSGVDLKDKWRNMIRLP
ncbi:uncharacterized protein LOC114187915 isoform X3 [Vigna unguiculata]|uniref:uncharacterized protein LOC114187915 isoform X3 n=1 Tax=Vigna unguiculata TaxID=3917 RepID=UPI001016AB1D|nr:uncharacterized protein LOC114187915 isoform X3 [Vigna unguiculata]